MNKLERIRKVFGSIFTFAILNLLGFGIAISITLAVLDGFGYIPHSYKAKVTKEGDFSASLKILEGRPYRVQAQGESGIAAMALNCNYPFIMNGVSSKPATMEETLGRCNGESSHIVNTNLTKAALEISSEKGDKINAYPEVLLTSDGYFELFYRPIWSREVYIFLLVWGVIVFAAALFLNVLVGGILGIKAFEKVLDWGDEKIFKKKT